MDDSKPADPPKPPPEPPSAPPPVEGPRPPAVPLSPVTPVAESYEIDHDTLQGLVAIITGNPSPNITVGECMRFVGRAQRVTPIVKPEPPKES